MQQYETIQTQEQLERWIQWLDETDHFAVDCETTGLNAMKHDLVGICLAAPVNGYIEACYIPLAHYGDYKILDANGTYVASTYPRPRASEQLNLDYVLDELAPLFENPDIAKIGQGIIYDLVVLGRYGCYFENVHDTMLMDYALTVGREKQRGMDYMAQKYLQHRTIKFGEVVNKRMGMETFDEVRLDHATFYAAEDAEVTLDLFYHLHDLLDEKPDLWRVYDEIDRPLLPVLADMKLTGIGVSRKKIRRLEKELTTKLADIDAQIDEIAPGLEHTSNQKLAAYLFGTRGLTPIKVSRKTGAPSVDAEVMEALADEDEVVSLIMERRKLEKIVGTYCKPLLEKADPETGRIHATLKIGTTNTGRFASEGPNLQNIPARGELGKMMRELFVAPKGRTFVGCDYSQIEVRVLAHVAKDAGLIKGFHAGLDAHDLITSLAHGVTREEIGDEAFGAIRRDTKSVTFGTLYGSTAMGIAKQLKVTPYEAQELIDKVFAGMPGVPTWIDDIHERAAASGYVYTAFGRRLYVGRGYGSERKAQNYPIQGGAGDLMKLALIKLHNALEDATAQLLLTVHDEVIVECDDDPETVERVKELVEHSMVTAGDEFLDWRVPIVAEAEAGRNWGDIH